MQVVRVSLAEIQHQPDAKDHDRDPERIPDAVKEAVEDRVHFWPRSTARRCWRVDPSYGTRPQTT